MLFVKTVSRLDRDSIGRCFSLHFKDRYLQDSCLKNTLVNYGRKNRGHKDTNSSNENLSRAFTVKKANVTSKNSGKSERQQTISKIS